MRRLSFRFLTVYDTLLYVGVVPAINTKNIHCKNKSTTLLTDAIWTNKDVKKLKLQLIL